MDEAGWHIEPAVLSLNEPVHLGGKPGDIKLPDTYIQKLGLSSLSSRKADNSLVMNRLRVSKADAGLTARLAQTIGMSSDTALDLLRDSDDRIILQIKEGQTALQTDLASIYAAAMLGVMQKAALAYVKNLFKPYGMAMDALQWGGKESRRMRPSAIFFLAGLDTRSRSSGIDGKDGCVSPPA